MWIHIETNRLLIDTGISRDLKISDENAIDVIKYNFIELSLDDEFCLQFASRLEMKVIYPLFYSYKIIHQSSNRIIRVIANHNILNHNIFLLIITICFGYIYIYIFSNRVLINF